MNEYEKLASEFLEKNNIVIEKEFLKRDKYFQEDKEARNIFNITIKNTLNNQNFSFTFWDSIFNTYSENNIVKRFIIDNKAEFWKNPLYYTISRFNNSPIVLSSKEREILKEVLTKKPDDYTILSCIGSDYIDDYNFNDFCDTFGYDKDSIKALDLFNSLQKQSLKIKRFFTLEQIDYIKENFN